MPGEEINYIVKLILDDSNAQQKTTQTTDKLKAAHDKHMTSLMTKYSYAINLTNSIVNVMKSSSKSLKQQATLQFMTVGIGVVQTEVSIAMMAKQAIAQGLIGNYGRAIVLGGIGAAMQTLLIQQIGLRATASQNAKNAADINAQIKAYRS